MANLIEVLAKLVVTLAMLAYLSVAEHSGPVPALIVPALAGYWLRETERQSFRYESRHHRRPLEDIQRPSTEDEG